MSSSVELVVKALESLYSNPDPSAKEQANAWLSEFQKSVSAVRQESTYHWTKH